MVKPCDFSRAMVWPICWMMTGARPSVGSSSIRKLAPVRRMRAIASICCSPPDSFVPWLFSRSFRFGNSSKIWSSVSPPGRTTGGSRRFSRTSRLAKMPRSSGHSAMPSRAILSEVIRISSRPLNWTEPVRLPMIPMIDFKVVVLPAPLRPSRVTTSPAFTWKFMPWRMWDSPYQLSRFLMSRMVPAAAAGCGFVAVITSGMSGPQIGFLDAFVLGELRIRPLGQHLPAGQHGDGVREVGDDAEIMLDHQDRVLGGDALDQRGDLVDVLVAHAGHRLGPQHHLPIQRPGRRRFPPTPSAIRHLDRRP